MTTSGCQWQHQALAIDSKFNSYRFKGNPSFKTLYLRRRSQLLRDYERNYEEVDRKQYLKLRTQLLYLKYNVSPDQISICSRNTSNLNFKFSGSTESKIYDKGSSFGKDDLIPTRHATASRALVGDNSTSDNYAFVGVHHIFDHHSAAVTLLKFANNDRRLLCCSSNDGTLSICDVTAEPPKVESILKAHNAPVTGFDWSASNDVVVSCSLDGTVCVWDMTTFKCIRRVRGATPGKLHSCLFHPANNNMVVIGNENGSLCALNISTGKYPKGGLCKVAGKILCLTFDADGDLLWAGTDKGTITSVKCDKLGQLTKCKCVIVAQNCAITCLNWRSWISREARDPTLLVNCAANAVCLYRVLDDNGGLQLKKKFNIRHRNGNLAVHSIFCPIMSFRKGACIVSGSEDYCVYFIDIEKQSNVVVNKLQGHSCPVLGVSFSYDESLLATSDIQGLVIIWSRKKRQLPSQT